MSEFDILRRNEGRILVGNSLQKSFQENPVTRAVRKLFLLEEIFPSKSEISQKIEVGEVLEVA